MKAFIRSIEYFLPGPVVTTEQLANEFPEWSVRKIDAKTGISCRHIAAPEECSSDLAFRAAQRLFESGVCSPPDIDFILFCTQTPDYLLPTTACLLQDRLGIPSSAGAFDFNLGCSGYVYGLGIAQGLIETGQACRVLLLTADTYSKLMAPADRSVRTIFGDAAAATLVEACDAGTGWIGPFVYGTDGSGGPNLIVHRSGLRDGVTAGGEPWPGRLYMNGGEIFEFTIKTVPVSVSELLARAGVQASDVDLFVFHQANAYMLEHLRSRMGIPREKFFLHLAPCGNTVSSTIPIALNEARKQGRLPDGALVALVGFGVGYSWGAALIRWRSR